MDKDGEEDQHIYLAAQYSFEWVGTILDEGPVDDEHNTGKAWRNCLWWTDEEFIERLKELIPVLEQRENKEFMDRIWPEDDI